MAYNASADIEVNFTTSETGGNGSLTSYSYRSFLISSNATLEATIDQTFSFANYERQVSVSGGLDISQKNITIPPSSIKWTIRINSSLAFVDGLNISYALSSLVPMSTQANSRAPVRSVSASDNTTTFYIPLLSSSSGGGEESVAVLQVFRAAIVDGILQPIGYHLISNPQANGTNYLLVLEFPPFTRSLDYDPIVSLGSLINTGEGSSGGGDNTGLIVGVTVGVTLAALIVLVVITVSTVIGIKMKRRRARFLHALSARV